MPDFNKPVNDVSIINDIQRRLRVLERTARVLPTNEVIPELVPTNGTQVAQLPDFCQPLAYDSTLRTQVRRVSDLATVSMPAVTVTGSTFLVFWIWQEVGYGTGGIFKAETIWMKLALDGNDLDFEWFHPGVYNDLLTVERAELFGVVSAGSGGPHTLQTKFAAPAGTGATVEARVANQSLVAVPVQF